MNGKMGMRIMVGVVAVMAAAAAAAATVVLLVTSKSSQFFLSTKLLGSPHFMFSIFNSIILLIIGTYHRPPPHQSPYHIRNGSCYPGSYQGYYTPYQHIKLCVRNDEHDADDEYEDDSQNEKDEIEQLNEDETEQCDEKDEDVDDEDETERCDEEDDDDELEKRIEEFIAKVNKRWREEKLRDNLLNQFCSRNVYI